MKTVFLMASYTFIWFAGILFGFALVFSAQEKPQVCSAALLSVECVLFAAMALKVKDKLEETT